MSSRGAFIGFTRAQNKPFTPSRRPGEGLDYILLAILSYLPLGEARRPVRHEEQVKIVDQGATVMCGDVRDRLKVFMWRLRQPTLHGVRIVQHHGRTRRRTPHNTQRTNHNQSQKTSCKTSHGKSLQNPLESLSATAQSERPHSPGNHTPALPRVNKWSPSASRSIDYQSFFVRTVSICT